MSQKCKTTFDIAFVNKTSVGRARWEDLPASQRLASCGGSFGKSCPDSYRDFGSFGLSQKNEGKDQVNLNLKP
ncbi:hypothetical protein SAMN03080598_00990 [Algoriphagus boritolerans DSM 17298 = JCM 18970]|uniref:Uncharacterized protein n=1 Tax=Algoriphagus boritolerans DSM 17298 = JCM 18970 TaxID=1120964 RepID=A0A1H5TZJ4_9BACT|nr:hypothetical protein SAMN03080598_00990 [Algoriphagus boritolerans DSM 17298 = JCM 18970]